VLLDYLLRNAAGIKMQALVLDGTKGCETLNKPGFYLFITVIMMGSGLKAQ
jgi:hypothetical protein